MAYKSNYTWPNPAFPFRIYYEGDECRIFLIQNIHHNWNWLSENCHNIKPNDFFFVVTAWYHDVFFARQAEALFTELNLNKDNFFLLFNSDEEHRNFAEFGFNGRVINHNAFIDEKLVMKIISDEEKLFDAIYIARLTEFKRHYLAAQVPNLALIAGFNHRNPLVQNLPAHIYKNDRILTPEEVCVKINQSRCGLILSAFEGACYSSSEYLLCGLPVVSTISNGGRDVWYDDYNSIVVEPDEKAIKEAVEFFQENPRDPNVIRQNHIEKGKMYKQHFVEELDVVFKRYGVSQDASSYFDEMFIHKLLHSETPNFQEIFPDRETTVAVNQ